MERRGPLEQFMLCVNYFKIKKNTPSVLVTAPLPTPPKHPSFQVSDKVHKDSPSGGDAGGQCCSLRAYTVYSSRYPFSICWTEFCTCIMQSIVLYIPVLSPPQKWRRTMTERMWAFRGSTWSEFSSATRWPWVSQSPSVKRGGSAWWGQWGLNRKSNDQSSTQLAEVSSRRIHYVNISTSPGIWGAREGEWGEMTILFPHWYAEGPNLWAHGSCHCRLSHCIYLGFLVRTFQPGTGGGTAAALRRTSTKAPSKAGKAGAPGVGGGLYC